MDDAACSGTGTKPFFPDDTTGIHRDQIEATKAVCDGCKVEETCLTYALVHRIEHGIWGGTTEVERRRLVGAL
jgi:WhiB family redox-sensing transcriptional regulator